MKLADHTRALEDSNRDLQEFAYVASHDLQEPLRMITSYLLLLSERYRGRLDQDADEFIGFAADGAKRMKQLINDLLAFTRLGRDEKGFVKVETSALLQKVIDDLTVASQECQAEIKATALPEVIGNPFQLSRLFQNIIENSLKYRREESPKIEISASQQGTSWRFSIADNGLGIQPEFTEKIFGMFQRLHGRDKYSGSGIGLAICRRIVSLHGGRIWVESEFGKGSVFNFTIPTERKF
jgi:light-regulated signal transduction histidine kinase (bacteriophytochrome)